MSVSETLIHEAAAFCSFSLLVKVSCAPEWSNDQTHVPLPSDSQSLISLNSPEVKTFWFRSQNEIHCNMKRISLGTLSRIQVFNHPKMRAMDTTQKNRHLLKGYQKNILTCPTFGFITAGFTAGWQNDPKSGVKLPIWIGLWLKMSGSRIPWSFRLWKSKPITLRNIPPTQQKYVHTIPYSHVIHVIAYQEICLSLQIAPFKSNTLSILKLHSEILVKGVQPFHLRLDTRVQLPIKARRLEVSCSHRIPWDSHGFQYFLSGRIYKQIWKRELRGFGEGIRFPYETTRLL